MKAQRGSILLYALLALAVVTICGGAVYAYNSAIEESARLRSDLAATQFALDDQVSENAYQAKRQKDTDRLLAKRDGAREERERLERMIDEKLATVLSNSPEAREWWNQRVPADLVRSVRNDPAGRAVDKDGARIPAADADPAKRGR